MVKDDYVNVWPKGHNLLQKYNNLLPLSLSKLANCHYLLMSLQQLT